MPEKPSSRTPDPRRSEINKLNRQKWRGLSPEGREKVRATTLANRPWEKSTGPRTPEGKARSARNSRAGQEGKSARALRTELAEMFSLINQMAATRRSLT